MTNTIKGNDLLFLINIVKRYRSLAENSPKKIYKFLPKSILEYIELDNHILLILDQME